MPKRVKIKTDTLDEFDIVVDDFNLQKDYYDYVEGKHVDKNGNLLQSIKIGENHAFQLLSIKSISVEDVVEGDETGDVNNLSGSHSMP